MADRWFRNSVGTRRLRTTHRRLVWLLMPALLFTSRILANPLCPGDQRPHLSIETAMGRIVVELDEAAAPTAVRELVELVRAPVPASGATGAEPGAPAGGHYDGLSFDRVVPHVEIVTAARSAGDRITIESQIDANVLGLGEQRIADAGEAMDVAQMELAPAYKKSIKTGSSTPLLVAWMERLYTTHDAGFLVGVSRQEINEALGYVYQSGLRSLPVTRGSVLLEPISPTLSSPRLSFVLVDMPRRTGRWMVVGKVDEGLEIIQAISIRPLADPAVVRRKDRPLDPVEIVSVRFDCQ